MSAGGSRIVVVGGGVVGLACAYELIQDGHEVTVLDGGRVGQEASHGNAAKIALAESGPVPAPGMVVQGLKWMLKADSPLYVRPSASPALIRFMLRMARNCTQERFRAGLQLHLQMASTCMDLLDEWRHDGLDFEMHRRGVLLVWENREGFEARREYDGVFAGYCSAPEALDLDGVKRVEPTLSERNRYGLFYPDDRQIEPDSLTRALAERVAKLGGQIRENCAVEQFVRHDGQVRGVVAGGELIPCDRLVLAAGVWTGPLSKQLGVPLPIRPGKGYSVDYRPAPVPLATPLTFEDAHVAVTPLDGVVRVAGTMEFGGFENSINRRRVEAVKRAAAEGFESFDIEAPHDPYWAGMRPMTPDGLPVVGTLAPGSNVVVASGHGMLGLTLAPSTARTVRTIVRGDGSAEDPRVSPTRFRS